MVTLEQKIDIILRYIATEDETELVSLKEAAFAALQSDVPYTPAHDDHEDILDNIIEDLLKEIGIPCHLKGHAHLCCALKLCYSDKEYIDAMTKLMYPVVAAHCDTTATRVERAIRHAIECVWNSRDIENAMAIFGNTISIDKGKPTNSEFIAACAATVKRRMRERGAHV